MFFLTVGFHFCYLVGGSLIQIGKSRRDVAGDVANKYKRKRWQNHGVATGERAPTEVAGFFSFPDFSGAPCHAITSPPRRAFTPSLRRSERLGSGLIPP